MKGTKRRHGFACLLCMVIFLLAAVPVSAVSYTTDGFFTTLDVREDSSMHVTEEIYVTFTSPGHGIFRYIPNRSTKTYYMYDGELKQIPLRYYIDHVVCEGEEVETESEDGNLIVRIGSPDRTVTGPHKYKLEYDIVMYVDGIDYLDQMYWNVVPAYWDTDIDFAAFTINMPKEFDESAVDVITGPVGTGDTSRASWDKDGTTIAGHVDGLEHWEGITVRIVLPQGYWVGARDNTLVWRILQGAIALITVFVAGLFLRKGRDPKAVETVEFYPPDDLSPAEIGYIYDNQINDRDMTSLVMWFASKGYLKILAWTTETKFLKRDKVSIILQKVKDLPANAPAYQRRFFEALFEYGNEAHMDSLAVSTSFADGYAAAKESLSDRYGPKTKRKLQEGYGNMAIGCLAGIIVFIATVFALVFLVSTGGNAKYLLIESGVCGFIILLCTFAMSRPTDFRVQMLGRIKGFREFIRLAELDRIEKLVEQDPEYFYKILPYAYVFDLTDKWAKNFDALAPDPPVWYDGPTYYLSTPSVFCKSMDSGVRSALAESAVHTTSSSDFSGGGSFSSGGGGFSGGGGGGGGGGGW